MVTATDRETSGLGAAEQATPGALFCPACEKADGLWEEVMYQGWQSVDAHADERGRAHTEYARRGHPDHEIDRHAPVDRMGQGGCSHCGWEGAFGELVRIGTDGRPLPKVHPRQLAIDHAAPTAGGRS